MTFIIGFLIVMEPKLATRWNNIGSSLSVDTPISDKLRQLLGFDDTLSTRLLAMEEATIPDVLIFDSEFLAEKMERDVDSVASILSSLPQKSMVLSGVKMLKSQM